MISDSKIIWQGPCKQLTDLLQDLSSNPLSLICLPLIQVSSQTINELNIESAKRKNLACSISVSIVTVALTRGYSVFLPLPVQCLCGSDQDFAQKLIWMDVDKGLRFFWKLCAP